MEALFIATYFVAVCMTENLGIFKFLVLLQPALIWLIVSMLYRGMPAAIRVASDENCFRMDGSRSLRRETREKVAMRKIRTDLYSVLTGIMLGGVWLFLIVNALIPTRYPFLEEFKIGFLTIGFSFLLASYFLLRFSYLRTLAIFYAGVRSRKEVYLSVDVARLQNERAFEPTQI